MYRILKEKGNNQNITLKNVETKASIIIGKLNMGIMRELEKEVEFDESKEHTIKLKDAWDFTVSDETAKTLMKIASPIKKPVRAKISTITSKEFVEGRTKPKKKKTKTGREVVDVFDLIYGTTD